MSRCHAALILILSVASSAVSARCVDTATTERLSALRVASCLWTESRKKPIVTELRETLTNTSSRDIVLELHRAPVLRFQVDISRDGEVISITPRPPVLHDSKDPWAVPRESIALSPGKSVTLAVPLRDLMNAPPKPRALYRIAITHSYPWRYPDEPSGQAFRLRLEEGNRKQSHVASVVFEGVRLK